MATKKTPTAEEISSAVIETMPDAARIKSGEMRMAAIERRLARLEDRTDRIADALVPALHAWKNLVLRIPRWLLSTAPPEPLPDPLRPPDRRAESDVDEEDEEEEDGDEEDGDDEDGSDDDDEDTPE